MTDPTTARRRLGAIATVGLALVTLTGCFTVTGSQVETGLEQADGPLDLAAGTASTSIGISAMMPGQSEAYEVELTNTGSGEVSYQMRAAFGPRVSPTNLGEALSVSVRDADFAILGATDPGQASGAGTQVFGPQGGAGEQDLPGTESQVLTVVVTYPADGDRDYAEVDADTELVLTFETTD